jgi:hypothetical protein
MRVQVGHRRRGADARLRVIATGTKPDPVGERLGVEIIPHRHAERRTQEATNASVSALRSFGADRHDPDGQAPPQRQHLAYDHPAAPAATQSAKSRAAAGS